MRDNRSHRWQKPGTGVLFNLGRGTPGPDVSGIPPDVNLAPRAPIWVCLSQAGLGRGCWSLPRTPPRDVVGVTLCSVPGCLSWASPQAQSAAPLLSGHGTGTLCWVLLSPGLVCALGSRCWARAGLLETPVGSGPLLRTLPGFRAPESFLWALRSHVSCLPGLSPRPGCHTGPAPAPGTQQTSLFLRAFAPAVPFLGCSSPHSHEPYSFSSLRCPR